MHASGQPFPCPPWCSGAGCDEHLEQAVVHREIPEPPVVSGRDREQLLTMTLEQHDDPHGIQPGEPFVTITLGCEVMNVDVETLGWIVEQANAARMKLLHALGEPVVPLTPSPRRPRGWSSGRSRP